MLADLETKTDKTQAKMDAVNERSKEALAKLNDKSTNICIYLLVFGLSFPSPVVMPVVPPFTSLISFFFCTAGSAWLFLERWALSSTALWRRSNRWPTFLPIRLRLAFLSTALYPGSLLRLISLCIW
jgi:hypothetical protein